MGKGKSSPEYKQAMSSSLTVHRDGLLKRGKPHWPTSETFHEGKNMGFDLLMSVFVWKCVAGKTNGKIGRGNVIVGRKVVSVGNGNRRRRHLVEGKG